MGATKWKNLNVSNASGAFFDKAKGSPIKGVKYGDYGINKELMNIDT